MRPEYAVGRLPAVASFAVGANHERNGLVDTILMRPAPELDIGGGSLS
jgi:hypothetical protein